ncbi:MFS transporter [Cupriavidus sp. AcVe19-1a]|uniref:MFS transporter n=1 Tax=Cupriavidus sp. AcVe19-1a TaxID=2821359 RepID=UPI001AE36E7F|nr:MFS transporter [Cupriavidus sp. AcVe19-1a]MBP0632377.1 MFS transporter [Cupriavidus sp. AcVe19-1a]
MSANHVEASPSAGTRQPLRASIGAFVGTTIEWYDFYIFATGASLVFGQVFFPSGNPFLATLGALGTFAAGFLARPLGALIFGSLGDRLGRKNILVITLLLMGGSTVLIGLLPSYASVGAVAPVLLVVLRIAQGIAVGGEWGGAVLLAAEHGTDGKKTFFASFPQLGSPAGMILSIFAFRAVATLPQDDLLSWGWRLPFLASAVLMVVGLMIRHGVDETPEFESIRHRAAHQKPSALAVFLRMPRLLLLAAGANTIGVAAVYFNVVFMLTYTTQYLHLPRAMILECVLYATVLQFCVQPVAAWMADKVGAARFVLLTSLVTVVTPFILYRLVSEGTPQSIMAGLGIVTLFCAAFYAAIAGFSASLFPTEVRYSAVSIAYQGCAAIAGGLTPILGTFLAEKFPGNWIPLAIAYASAAAISAICIAVLMRKQVGHSVTPSLASFARE